MWMDKAAQEAWNHRHCDANIGHQSIAVDDPSCHGNAIACEASMLCCAPALHDRHAVANCIVFWYVLNPPDGVPFLMTLQLSETRIRQWIRKDEMHAIAMAMAENLPFHRLLVAPRAGAIRTSVSAASGPHMMAGGSV